MYTHEEVHLMMQHLGVFIEKMTKGPLTENEKASMFHHLSVLQDVTNANWEQIAGNCTCELATPTAPSLLA